MKWAQVGLMEMDCTCRWISLSPLIGENFPSIACPSPIYLVIRPNILDRAQLMGLKVKPMAIPIAKSMNPFVLMYLVRPPVFSQSRKSAPCPANRPRTHSPDQIHCRSNSSDLTRLLIGTKDWSLGFSRLGMKLCVFNFEIEISYGFDYRFWI